MAVVTVQPYMHPSQHSSSPVRRAQKLTLNEVAQGVNDRRRDIQSLGLGMYPFKLRLEVTQRCHSLRLG